MPEFGIIQVVLYFKACKIYEWGVRKASIYILKEDLGEQAMCSRDSVEYNWEHKANFSGDVEHWRENSRNCRANPTKGSCRLQPGKSQNAGCPRILELTSITSCSTLDIKLKDLMFALQDFDLTLVQFLSVSLFLPFGMALLTVCHCMLVVLTLILDFHKGSQLSMRL